MYLVNSVKMITTLRLYDVFLIGIFDVGVVAVCGARTGNLLRFGAPDPLPCDNVGDRALWCAVLGIFDALDGELT